MLCYNKKLESENLKSVKERRFFMINDMTKGNPTKVLLLFSAPIMLSSIFQQFYNMADSVIAGQFISENALASVGASFPVTMLFVAIALGFSIGCSVIVSQYFGAGRYKDMKTAINTAFVSAITLGVILILLGVFLCEPILYMLNTPENIITDSKTYLDVYIYGILFLMIYNTSTGVFTALGDSKTPLYFLVASSIGNIGLDLLFVIQFDMGVAGIAWATFIAQGIASILSFTVVRRKITKFSQDEHIGKVPVYSNNMFKKIITIAVPSILQQSFISVGNLLIQGLINGYGSSVVAGYSSAMKISVFAVMAFSALSSGLSSFTAQNIGAGKIDRVKKGFKSGLIIGISVATIFTILFVLFGKEILSLFLDTNSEDAIKTGVSFLVIVALFYPIICVKLIIDAVLRGGGAMLAFMIATFTDLVLRVILAFALSPIFGEIGIWSSWPIGWTVASVISVIFYVKGVWENKSKVSTGG